MEREEEGKKKGNEGMESEEEKRKWIGRIGKREGRDGKVEKDGVSEKS